jgi:hypothetical protein
MEQRADPARAIPVAVVLAILTASPALTIARRRIPLARISAVSAVATVSGMEMETALESASKLKRSL